MTPSIDLAFTRHDSEAGRAVPPLVIAHGLFGSGRNWASLARRFSERRATFAADLRNHGESPWAEPMDYPAMAEDLGRLIAREAGGKADLIGHSMGGKAAMILALTRPERLRRLLVLDMAPRRYAHEYGHYLSAMQGLDMGFERRSEADAGLKSAIPDAGLRAFILQNLVAKPGGGWRWRLNLDGIAHHMREILDWAPPSGARPFTGEVLFLAGGASPYVRIEDEEEIKRWFPFARIRRIPGAGHWPHAEKPEEFLKEAEDFLSD